MPTIEHIRELCAKVLKLEDGPKLDCVVIELGNTIGAYLYISEKTGIRPEAK